MVAGTIHEAIHYAVFSNFLLLSALKVWGFISAVAKLSVQSFFNDINQVSHPQL